MTKVARLEHGEDAGRGRAVRAATPRSSHGEWGPAPDHEDPIAILRRQAEPRVPELLPIRYGRMVASPFAIYRGAAAVMAADLAATPDSGLVVQLCGDAHISNFRRLRGARPSPRLRPRRLRRDAARPLGVGRQADGGEHRDRGAGARARGEAPGADRRRRRRPVPRGDARIRR